MFSKKAEIKLLFGIVSVNRHLHNTNNSLETFDGILSLLDKLLLKDIKQKESTLFSIKGKTFKENVTKTYEEKTKPLKAKPIKRLYVQ